MDKTQMARIAAANRKVLELAGGSHAEVARILGYTDRRNVWPWTNDLKPFPPHHCVTISRRWPGEIDLKQLRAHDWKRHWPDLEERDGTAPDNGKRRRTDDRKAA
jgi:DNA-binding transcriptional regulator YdaS (Cro superfamily)